MTKGLVYLIIGITMSIGSYVPVIFGAGLISAWNILGTFVGLGVGVYVVFKMNSYI